MGREEWKTMVAHPERHLAVIGEQGHIEDEASQELLQHGRPEVPAEQRGIQVKRLINQNISSL